MCIKAKQSVKPYPSHSAHTTQHMGKLTHLDVWGKILVQSIDKNQYFIGLIDNHTRYVTIEGLSLKCDATYKVKDYILSLKVHGKIPCAICCNEGSKFLSGDLTNWLKQEGVTLQTTAAYSPSQNGVAKRMNHTLVELVCAMVNGRKLPKFLWEFAIKHATYLWNWAYTCICKLTPYQAWTGEKLDISHLREFGTPIWILQQGAHVGHKLEPKSWQRLFIGFNNGTKVVKYYSLESWKILISRNYCFLTLPDTPLAVTKGIEIHTPNMQHKGEAMGSTPQSTPQSNADNMAGTLDAPDGPNQRTLKRKLSDNTADDILEEDIPRNLRKKPHVDYRLLNDPESFDLNNDDLPDLHQQLPTSGEVTCTAYHNPIGRDEPKMLQQA
jgi:hypothetical protein